MIPNTSCFSILVLCLAYLQYELNMHKSLKAFLIYLCSLAVFLVMELYILSCGGKCATLIPGSITFVIDLHKKISSSFCSLQSRGDLAGKGSPSSTHRQEAKPMDSCSMECGQHQSTVWPILHLQQFTHIMPNHGSVNLQTCPL